MISRAIVLWVLAVITVILVSVQIGLKAEALEDQIRTVEQKQEVERDRIRVLRASYAYLTAADQLKPLAQRHLALEPIRGDQVATLADLPLRVPVPIERGEEPGTVSAPPSEPSSAPSSAPSSEPAVPSADAPSLVEAPGEAQDDFVIPPRRQEPTPRGPSNIPPWLKAQQHPVLQPVGLPSQERSSR